MSDGWENTLKGWHNKPEKKIVVKGSKIIMKVPQGTDCWRKTKQGVHNIPRTVNNAPFHWQKITGNFQAIVNISGGFMSKNDKAGIMVRLDEENWILHGMEYCSDMINCSTSVALDHSDWSVAPLPDGAEKDGVWFCFKRVENAYECFYSLDSRKWVQTRQGLFTEEPELYVGIAGACPNGEEFRVTFENFKCSSKGFL